MAGAPNWFSGSLELTASRTGESASSSFVWNPDAGWVVQEITGNTTSTGSISEGRGAGAYADGSEAYYDSTKGSVSSSGIFTINDLDDLPLNIIVRDVTTGTFEVVTIVNEGGGVSAISQNTLSIGLSIGL